MKQHFLVKFLQNHFICDKICKNEYILITKIRKTIFLKY